MGRRSVTPSPAVRIPGSDTCTFETMEDAKAEVYMLHERKSLTKDASAVSKQSSKELEASKGADRLQKLPGRVTFPMDNLGNTCFFNSVMQCLTHTLPLNALCLSQSHIK